MKRFLTIALCLVMMSSAFAGCGGGNGTTSQAPAGDTGSSAPAGNSGAAESSAPAESSGGQKDRLVIARPIDSDNLDPVTNQYNQNIWLIENIAEGLVRLSDSGNEIEPTLATEWSTSDDGLVWTFKLREGVKFADGTPVTGADWVFSFERCMAHEEDSIFYTYVNAIEKVEAPDDSTFVITLKNQDPTLLTSMSMCNTRVISKAYFEANGGEDGVANGVMGTGPYYIKDWNKGENLLFAANEHYWREGLPKTKEIEWKVVADAETRKLMLEAGEVDLITEVPVANIDDLNNTPGLIAQGNPSSQTRYFIINHRKEPFGDVKVREAVRYALDLQQIIDIVMLGQAEPATSYIHKVVMYHNTDLPVPQRDVEKAKALLKEAGLENGFEFEYLIISGDAITEQIATVAKQQLAEVGITANIVVEENASFREKFANNGMTFYVGQWTMQSNDPASPSDYWWIYEQADAYMSGYQNARLTEINQLAKSEMDPAIRGGYFKEMQQTFYDDVVAIPLWWGQYSVAYRDTVHDFLQIPYGYYRLMGTTVDA